MKNLPLKFIILLLVAGTLTLLACRSGEAKSIYVPGDTQEEVEINQKILKSDKEEEVREYLADPRTSVRLTACRRLTDVGTALSRSALNQRIVDEDEDYTVVDEAAFALANIGLREANDPESYLLSALMLLEDAQARVYVDFETTSVPLTSLAGRWEPVLSTSPSGNGYYQQKDMTRAYYASRLNGAAFEDGRIDIRIRFTPFAYYPVNQAHSYALVYFRTNDSGDGYALYAQSDKTDRCNVALVEVKGYIIDSILQGDSIANFNRDEWHMVTIRAYGQNIEALFDGESVSAVNDKYASGNVLLGTFSLASPMQFDDLEIETMPSEGSAIYSVTMRVLKWAITRLGSMGLLSAKPYIEELRDESLELRNIAEDALAVIEFLNDPSVTDYLAEGLVHDHLAVRIWAVNELAKQETPDIERLEALLEAAVTAEDYSLSSEIAGILHQIREEAEKHVGLEILCPQNGLKTKYPYVEAFGYYNGSTFFYTIRLDPGTHSYPITSPDGAVTQNITIEFNNKAPILDAIGAKWAVAGGGPIAITLTAHDPDGMDDELIYYALDKPEGASFNHDTKVFTWSPQVVDTGTHVVRFEVEDKEGLSDSEEVSIIVTGLDATRPVVTIASPNEGSRVESRGFAFTGTAHSASGIRTVRVFVKDIETKTFTLKSAPASYNNTRKVWTYNIEPQHLNPGKDMSLLVKAFDINNNVSQTMGVRVRVEDIDTMPPVVTITSPGARDTVSYAGFTFSGTADDASGVWAVRVFVRDIETNAYTVRSAPASYSKNTKTWTYCILPEHLKPGNDMLLLVRAFDAVKNASQIIRVRVHVEADTTPPALTILTPANNERVPSTGFDITGTAEDLSGITEVWVSIWDEGRYSDSLGQTSISYDAGTKRWTFRVQPQHLTKGKKAYLYVRVFDKSGNTSLQQRVVNVRGY
ncbi:MAG: Ig-like domain-containing protein [Candidatus Omnitrophota bacterium]